MKELKAIRQGLPFRGHTDEEGNLEQLLNVCFDEHQWLDKGSYMSHDKVNEIIEVMS